MTTFDVGTSNTAYTTLAGMGFDVEILDNPDVAWHRATIHDWLVREAEVDLSVADPTDLHSGYNVLQSLEKAAGLEGLDRKEAVFKAYRKAQMLKYGRWARGEIKSKKEPMPEDVKEMLRARARPAIKDPHMVKSLAKSMGGIADQTDAKVSEIFHSVFGPTKPYGREVQERF